MSNHTEPPRNCIARVAFTPQDDTDATVIAEAHHCDPDPAALITPLEALRRCTRFELNPHHGTGTGWHLPRPVAHAMPQGASGTLHVWSWSHDHERGTFLAWFFPRVLVRARTVDWERHQVQVKLELRPSEPYLLPYLARLPADERPDPRQWNSSATMVVWPVDALPQVTHTDTGQYDPLTLLEQPLF